MRIPGIAETLGVKLRGKNVIRAMTRHGKPIEIVHDPSPQQLRNLTQPDPKRPAHETDSLRYIRDEEGNLFVANAYGFTHDDIAKALGEKLKGRYSYESKPGEGHGEHVRTGYYRRRGEEIIDDNTANDS